MMYVLFIVTVAVYKPSNIISQRRGGGLLPPLIVVDI